MKLLTLFAVFLISSLLPAFAEDKDACATFNTAAMAAAETNDLEKLQGLLQQARAGQSSCDAQYVYCLGRTVSRTYVQQAYSLSSQGRNDAELKPVLEQAIAAGPTWQAAFALAEVEETADKSDASRFDRSARYYQLAINDIDEIDRQGEVCPGEQGMLPDADNARMILGRASTASQLAVDFVPPPVTRSGEAGGVFLGSLRGVAPEAFPVPVTFEFDSGVFTEKGRKAAEFLLGFLRQKNLNAVRLSGHTDSKGEDAYNCALSKMRLSALKQYLVEAGFVGQIDIVPQGENQPVTLDDPSRYSEDEIAARNRRVELILSSSAAYQPCG